MRKKINPRVFVEKIAGKDWRGDEKNVFCRTQNSRRSLPP
jgi:hypothetical protein